MNAADSFKRIEEALKRSSRDASDLSVVAVSKKQSLDRIQEFLDLNLDYAALGESFLQELQEKQAQFAAKLNWHFVGRLQSRKISEICESVSCIHSVSREKELKLIQEWNSRTDDEDRVVYYLQVNVSGEQSKNGIDRAELKNWGFEMLNSDPCFSGLMAMPEPVLDVGEARVREQMVQLRELRDQLCPNKKINVGTTNDFELAIEEGSQVIRLGSCLFGQR